MGGCASKPKDSNGQNPGNLPAENPSSPELISKSVQIFNTSTTTPTEAKAEAAVEDHKDEKETKEEPPLVDLSDPKLEAPNLVGNSPAAEAKTTAGGVVESVPVAAAAESDPPQNPATDVEEDATKKDAPKENARDREVSNTHPVENGIAANTSTEKPVEKAAGAEDLVAVDDKEDNVDAAVKTAKEEESGEKKL